jgi:hypothetical protein
MKKNSFKFIIQITWIIIILCLIAIIKMIKVYLIDNRFDHEWDFLIYSIPIFISAVIFIMFLYNLKRAYTIGQKELNQDGCIVYWKYMEEEWERFNISEWKKSRNKSLLYPFIFLLVFFIIGFIDTEFSSGELSIAAPFILYFLISISAILLFYNYFLFKRTKTCPREVLIGFNGFLYGGYYNTWNAIGTKLGGVKIIQGEFPLLEFDVQVRGKYGYSSSPLRVPIPIGKEYEANIVVQNLNPV